MKRMNQSYAFSSSSSFFSSSCPSCAFSCPFSFSLIFQSGPYLGVWQEELSAELLLLAVSFGSVRFFVPFLQLIFQYQAD
jgi:hypothetical protein